MLRIVLLFLVSVAVAMATLPSIVLAEVPQTRAKSPTKHALLIGISDYSVSGLASLQGTHNDVELMREVLTDERFGFTDDNVQVLLDEQARHSKIKDAFAALVRRIDPGDFVYIHYSGHGSYTPDLNGDEPGDYDQTWVSYGSRKPEGQGLDDYDILDDELHEWLIPLFEKAGQVVLVSDSCHSASVTRGETPAVRAAPKDMSEHPLGKQTFVTGDLSAGVIIGAARDQEAAGEFSNEDEKIYGLFTWFWAQALRQAHPGETWQDVFRKTYAKVTQRRKSQLPQLRGKMAQQAVFGGAVGEISPRIAISSVSVDGKTASFKAGSLAGVTAGSVYRLYVPDHSDPDSLPTLTVTRVRPFYSVAEVSGNLAVGDLIVELSHASHISRIPLFISGDYAESVDKDLISSLKSSLVNEQLLAYRLVETQQEAEVVLYVLHPQKVDGVYLKADPLDTLPQSFADQPPQVWLLTDTMELLNDELRISCSDPQKATELLRRNLKTLARVKEIKQLASSTSPNFVLTTQLWHQVDSCDETDAGCRIIYNESTDEESFFTLAGDYSAAEMEQQSLSNGDILTFKVTNNDENDYYIYLLNVTPRGEVQALYPAADADDEAALLEKGETRDTEAGIRTDQIGEETIKLLVSRKPVDISLLEQGGFVGTRGTKGALNPLEKLLADAMYGTRGEPVSAPVKNWGTLQYSVRVTE
ncbi:MAG: hypothetical protein C0622_00225 [Desulfuromonas sp.]|nr:MAG: hypothetical protein C0622_00225 [Desulfuromonas sp.]